MDKKKVINILGPVVGLLGVGLSFANSLLSDKKQEMQITEAANKAVAEALNKGDN